MIEVKPNSERSKHETKPEATKVINGVSKPYSTPATRVRNTIFNSDWSKDLGNTFINNMIVPSMQDLITNCFQTASDIFMEAVKTCIYGDDKPRVSSSFASRNNRTNYSKISRGGVVQRGFNTNNTGYKYHKAHSGFENVLLETMNDANSVRDKMMQDVIEYDFVSVADFCSYVGADPKWTDDKWGWYPDAIEKSKIRRMNGGWILDLPEPEPLDG